MTKSAAALLGAALVVACTPVTTFDMLVTSDRDLFSACTPSLMAAVCGKGGDDATKTSCLASRSAAFGKLRSPKIRRSWLIANGCPPATIDAPPKPAAEIAVAPGPPAPPPEPAAVTAEPLPSPEPAPLAAEPPSVPEPAPVTAEPPPPPKPIASPPPPTPEPQPSPPPPRSPPPVAAAPRPPPSLAKAARPRTRSLDVFDLRLEAAADSLLSFPKPPAPPPPPEPAPVTTEPPLPEPVAPKARPTGPAARAFSDKERREEREQRLREIIVAHRPEMKACVDRQLKLLPNLRAEGTLVIEVDAGGSVPRSELLGADLAGTPLEDCLRTIASRWRFPSAGRAYRIDAPVRVWGTASDR